MIEATAPDNTVRGNLLLIMKKVSKKQLLINRKINKIKKNLNIYCEICGNFATDPAHLVPKSLFPEHYTNPLNIVGLCRRCHTFYDDNLSFRKKQKKLIDRVKSFDENAAIRYFDL